MAEAELLGTFKSGDTLLLECEYAAWSDAEKAWLGRSLAGYSVAASVRESWGTAMHDLTADASSLAAGQFSLTADMTGWNAGLYELDIQLTAPGGAKASTQTYTIRIEEDITQ